MTEPIVLVAADDSKSASAVLPIARRLAALTKAEVRNLHATEEGRPLGAEAILAAARDCGAGLVVIAGAHSDTALAVLSGAACPVVLAGPARAPANWDLRRLLALHDGSPAVSHALTPAGDLARAAGAEFMVLQVAQDACAEEPGSIAPPAYVDQVQYTWPGWSAEFLHRLHSVCPIADLPVRLLLGHGEPAAEAVRVAGEVSADLIVIAGAGEAAAATLQTLLREAPCPVMVTRRRAD